MIAVDTNVIVRLLTGDDPAQFQQARRLFETEAVFVPKTVILETEWVLRRLYGLTSRRVIHALSRLIALPQVQCEDLVSVQEALQLAGRKVDFADALHLTSSRGARRFVTFDRSLARHAVGYMPVTPP